MNSKVLFTVAIKKGKYEEYIRELHGDDCFSDDVGNAMLFDSIDSLPSLQEGEYIVRVDEDEDGGLRVIGKGETGEVISI